MSAKKKSQDSLEKNAHQFTEEYSVSLSEAVEITGLERSMLYRMATKDRSVNYAIKQLRKQKRIMFRPQDLESLKSRKTTTIVKAEPTSIVTPPDSTPPWLKGLRLPQTVDEETNPAVSRLKELKHPSTRGWTDREWDELAGNFGTGGALTDEGIVEKAEAISRKMKLRRKIEILLEHADHSKTLETLIDTLYKQTKITR